MIGALVVLVVVVGSTRLALGVHFLSDVLAGWALGTARTYGDALREQLWWLFLQHEAAAFLAGGLMLALIFRARAPLPQRLTGCLRVGFVALVVAGLTAASVGVAGWLFSRWNGSAEVASAYPMPGGARDWRSAAPDARGRPAGAALYREEHGPGPRAGR